VPAVGARLAGDQHGLARPGERQPGRIRVDGGQAVEQVLRVEGGLKALGLEAAGVGLLAVRVAVELVAGLQHLAGLGLIPGAGFPRRASSTAWPGVNDRRSAVLRPATSATRLTASLNGAVASSPTAVALPGSSARYGGNSPPSSRVVARRPPPSKPIIPSPAWP